MAFGKKELKVGMELLWVEDNKYKGIVVSEANKFNEFRIDWYYNGLETYTFWNNQYFNTVLAANKCRIISKDPEKVCKLK